MEEELFKIDIDVEEEVSDEIKKPDYFVDHFMIGGNSDEGLINESQGNDSSVHSSEKCWNCDNRGHCLRDCPLPANRIKINQAKKSFNKAQANSKRYHDNKFSKFRPGYHSSKLKDALGLRADELPAHIYKMRVLGYPPGWLAEAKITNSGIKMYNDRGKRIPEPGEEDGEILNKVMKYDVEKLIEFPGFNVQMDRSAYDDHRRLGYPPMKSEHKLKNFIKTLEELSNKAQDDSEGSTDDEPVDMEISDMLPSKIIEEVNSINKRISEIDDQISKSNVQIVNKKRSLNASESDSDEDSQDLKEIKRKKRKSDERLKNENSDKDDVEEGELEDNQSNTDDSDEKDKTELKNSSDNEIEEGEINDQVNESDLTLNDSLNVNDTSDNFTIKRSLPINIKNLSDDNFPSTPSPRGSVTSTSFGTPNLKPHSPYSKLPSFDNFNKDISDVIDFENLPDSTGKYDSLCSIITKIRSYMTTKTSKSEATSKEK